MRKLVEVGQGRQRMSYVWVYLYRSYIVMNPPTCGACLGSFASQKLVLK